MTPATIKFLLVDDLDANLIALAALLRRDGLELLLARSGPEALELLLVHDVALALLDVQMAGMDGFELAELMRGAERTRRVPIIFLTAGALDQQRRFRGYDAGAVDFIFKPVEPHILQSKAGIFFQLALQREALRQSAEQAHAASRAKDEFIAALSHELRTPLTPVLMAAAALREDVRIPADAREQLGMMERNIALEARLIDDLLDLTTITRGKLQLRSEPCDAHSLIGLAVEIVRAEAGAKGISIERSFAAGHSGLVADPARFQQVIWNLLRNAVKFTPRGGRILIETTEEKSPAGARWLRIAVTDSGIGIDPSLIERIFQPFEQGAWGGDHRYGGLGLGLAIARAVVELHGGRITATSAGVDRGATFVVELPGAVYPEDGVASSTAPFPIDSSAQGATSAKAPSPVSQRILLVEDHESTLKTLASLLRRDGHRVVTATTVADGLAAAAAERFDIVVSDLGLPDGTGNEMMEKLCAQHGLRGIALSGYGMEEDVMRSRAAGFATHLVKPIRIADLRLALAALSRRS